MRPSTRTSTLSGARQRERSALYRIRNCRLDGIAALERRGLEFQAQVLDGPERLASHALLRGPNVRCAAWQLVAELLLASPHTR
jgi:hypothetical protein